MVPHEMTETPRHSVSVAAAIFDDSGENVLLIKRRDNGNWEPPGGVLELDETIEQGLRREVREETGAEIRVGPLTGVYKNMPRGIIALVFACELKGAHESGSVEASEVAWVPLSRIDSRCAEIYAVRVRDARNASTPSIRHHDGKRILGSSS